MKRAFLAGAVSVLLLAPGGPALAQGAQRISDPLNFYQTPNGSYVPSGVVEIQGINSVTGSACLIGSFQVLGTCSIGGGGGAATLAAGSVASGAYLTGALSSGAVTDLTNIETAAGGAAPPKAASVQGISGGTPLPVDTGSSGNLINAIIALTNAVNSQTPLCSVSPDCPGSIGGVNQRASTTGGSTPFHVQSAASNNAQLVGAAGAHTLYLISGVNPTTSLACLHVYDNATSPTPGATAIKHTFTLGAASSAGVGVGGGVWPFSPGEAYSAGLAISVTGGASNTCTDADTSSAPLGVSIEISYK